MVANGNGKDIGNGNGKGFDFYQYWRWNRFPGFWTFGDNSKHY